MFIDASVLTAELATCGMGCNAAIAVARVLDLAISEAAEAVESYLSLMEIDMVAVPLTRRDSRLMFSIASARAGTRRG